MNGPKEKMGAVGEKDEGKKKGYSKKREAEDHCHQK